MPYDVPSLIIFLLAVFHALRENGGTHHILVGEIWARRHAAYDMLHHVHFALAAGNVSQHTGSHSSTWLTEFKTLIIYYKYHLRLIIFF